MAEERVKAGKPSAKLAEVPSGRETRKLAAAGTGYSVTTGQKAMAVAEQLAAEDKRMNGAVRALPDGFKIRTDLYQVMPPLGAEDMAKLRDSIAREGVQIPVIVREEDGGIIDGHHRWQIATELSMTGDVVLDIRSYATDALARAAAYEINDARRHMSLADRRELARRLEKSGANRKETAEVLGVSERTVDRDLSSIPSSDTMSEEGIEIAEVLAQRPPKVGARRTKNAAESAALTARIVELRQAGKTLVEIADTLGIGKSVVSFELGQVVHVGRIEETRLENLPIPESDGGTFIRVRGPPPVAPRLGGQAAAVAHECWI